MAVFELRKPLSAEERSERRKLILRDSVALFTVFAITVILVVLTYFLFTSFSRHRDVLARRWRANGERAMRSGQPVQAVQALHSALEYAPDNRNIEIELAMALAASGRDLEATSYFYSLLQTQPGNGLIHLQLARLAAKQGNAPLAEQHYQRALDGTWEGDGYVRRREVRLELASYLISRNDYTRAQTELRTAAGNAPKVPEAQLTIAALMEQARDPVDALEIYRAQMRLPNAPVEAFEGAGRTAYELGRIAVARDALARAVGHRRFSAQSEAERKAVRQMLADSTRILQLYPDPNLNVRPRAERILNNSKIVRARLASCFANANAAGAMASLQNQWQQLPTPLTVRILERNPQLEQTIMSLVYNTEVQTAQVCGAPTGDDALLLKIARAPLAVQQQ
ncbi:MAG: tetratricopeptide repeat protein [Acidobacteriaceae bacterium]